MKTKVSIVRGSKDPQEDEIRGMVERSIALIDGIDDIISKGDRVLIKPNIAYEIKEGETEVTDPRVAKAVYDIVAKRGAHPIIAESSASGVDGEAAFNATGYYNLRDQGYNVVNLKKPKAYKIKTIDNPKAKVLKRVKLWELATEVDVLISLPVIKTHDHEPATLALKNMKGLMPDSEKKNFHNKYGLFQAIADLNLVVRPQLTIVDGIFCREGLGYPWSEELEMDLIIAGKDPVSVDTVTLMVMDINPKEQKHAVLAEKAGIGTMDINKIDIVGEELELVKRKFKRPAEQIKEMLDLQDFNLISNETTCTGCRGTMFFFLKYMKDLGRLDEIKGYTFVLGKHDTLPPLDKEKTVLVGVCTEQYKGLGRYVPGCPPLSSDIMSAIFEESKAAYVRS
jgi:uncharacterized protein (DUF362 family)